MNWFIWWIGGLLCILEMLFRNAPTVMTQELSTYYNLNSTQLGLLVSSYYYPYVLLQIPGGIILDILGTRRMALFIASVSTVAFTIFSSGLGLWSAYLGRILLGLSASCAFITALQISVQWFSKKDFSKMSGLTNMMLTIGGVTAGYPLAYLVQKFNWQSASFMLSGVGFFWTLLIFFTMKEKESERKKHFEITKFTHAIKSTVKNKILWRIGLISACLYLPFSAFAELWAVPYLTTTYNLKTTQAASIGVLLYIGSAFGSIFLNPLLRLVGGAIPGLKLTAMGIGIIFLLMYLFSPFSYPVLSVIFFSLGIITVGQMFAFTWAHENAVKNQEGVSFGFVNSITMMAPPFVQPMLGYVLDLFWEGQYVANGLKIYTAQAYRSAILIFPVFSLIALVILYAKRGRS